VIKCLFNGNYSSVDTCAVASWGSQKNLLASAILDISHPSMINGSLVDCGGLLQEAK
jgi:hypothetical protein